MDRCQSDTPFDVGTFYVDAEISNVNRRKSVKVSHLLVDAGSGFTWASSKALSGAGIRVTKKDQMFVMANGQHITRSVGYCILRVEDFETVDEVVFAQPGDLTLLGSRTLEGFGAQVDARQKRLVAAGPHLAASPAQPRGRRAH
ncbi:MAG: hypothetical protein HY270_20405 [Deltaproteobacteria bacterium]|nr:hypothetical protein [Deltaproteobacteria bacterium]